MSVDRETLAVYDAKAAEYDAHFFAGSAGPDLKRFMEAVPAGGHILDLGCGPGGAASLMQSAGFQMTCFDASTQMVATARARGLNAEQRTFDEIDGVAIYDGIWANFSLLHAPRSALPVHFAALSRALKAGGAFHIGMKTGVGEARDALGRLYTFVTVDEICGLLNDAGIEVTTRHAFTEVGMAGTDDACLIVQGRKNG